MELDEVKIVFSSELENVESNADKLISTLEKLLSVVDSVSASMQRATSSAEGFNSFLQSISESASMAKEATSSFTSMTQGIEQIGGVSKSASDDLDKIAESASAFDEAGKKAENSGNQAAKAAVKWSALFAGFAKGAKAILGFTENAANAIGDQMRFNAVFNETEGELENAQRWTKEFADALYLDQVQVQGLAANMKLLTRNLGISNEMANKMTENLTKVAYDLAAWAKVSPEQAMKNLGQGLSGQTKALRNYGIALNQATLQNTLYANGIKRTVSSLNSAEKAYLTYYQIMKITAGQQGYLAKTVMTPANALNVIKTQFNLLAREIGNVFIPILMAAVPVIIMITNALRALAKALASFFGLKIDFDKYSSGIGSIGGGIDGIGKSADTASKKMKNMLRDFDELHVVDFGDNTGGAGGSGGGAGGGGIGFELPEVDYAGNLDFLDKIKEKFEKIKDYVIAIGIALAGWYIATKVLDFFNKLFDWGLTGGQILLKGLGVGLILGGTYLDYKGTKEILDNGLTWQSILKVLTGSATIFGGSMLLTGGDLRLSLAITLGIESIISMFEGNRRMLSGQVTWSNVVAAIGGSFGLALATLIATKSWQIAGLVLVLSLTISFFIAAIEYFNLNKYSKGAGAKAAEGFNKGVEIELANGETTTAQVISSYWQKTIDTTDNKMIDLQSVVENGLNGVNTRFDLLDTQKPANKFELLQSDSRKSLDKIDNQTSNTFLNMQREISSKTDKSSQDFKKNFGDMETNTKTTTTKILTQGKTSFHNLQQTIDTSVSDANKSVSNNTKAISKSAENMSKDIDKYTENSKKSFLSLSNLPIKLPHITLDWDTTSMSARFMQLTMGLPRFPKIKR